MGVGSSISISYSSSFSLVIIVALLARSWSLACELSLLALSIKNGLLSPHLSGYSWVPNNSRPLFLLVMIIKFPSIGGGCVIVSVVFYMRSDCVKRAILFVWMPLR